jgi:hypothetical protein
MADEKSITLGEAVLQVLEELDGTISMSEFGERVFAIYPSKAKKPMSVLRNHLRWEGDGISMTYLDRQTIIPLRVAMKGVRLRIPVGRQEASHKVLFVEPFFRAFVRRDVKYDEMELVDEKGHALPVRVVDVKQSVSGVFGHHVLEVAGFDLGGWFRANRVRRNDSVLVTVEDWQNGLFRLEHEPAKRRSREEIESKNRELADIFFDMLEAARDEQLYAPQAVPKAYARLSDPRGYPGDYWIDVIEQDDRMKWDGFNISYIESLSPLERMLSPEEVAAPEATYSQEEATQVYRFRAALQYRRGLWRRIEIQGQQTLADFDNILRDAFEHDDFDHMSGFWKRVRRGTGKRFREVDVGDINPIGGGSGFEVHVAGLALEPGQELKYVYDFGDWIEHRITLEEIAEPEAGAEYPRIVGRNKPQYRYCQSCQAKGRETVATWVCIECSNMQPEDVLVCKDCLMEEHEDHYAQEILY